jgi:hypothetical protein
MLQKIYYFSLSVIIVISFLYPSDSQAQVKFEITPYYGYLVSTNARVAEGEFVVKDSPTYGLALNIGHENLPGGMMIQLLYARQDTDTQLEEYPSGTRKDLWPITIEYYQIGVVRPVKTGKVRPYGIVGLGASNWTPGGSSEWSNQWFFAANFGGGALISFSETVGLQLQARALLPMNFSGGGFFCGTGGCSVGLGSYGFIAQFDFTAGLTIALGGKQKQQRENINYKY